MKDLKNNACETFKSMTYLTKLFNADKLQVSAMEVFSTIQFQPIYLSFLFFITEILE